MDDRNLKELHDDKNYITTGNDSSNRQRRRNRKIIKDFRKVLNQRNEFLTINLFIDWSRGLEPLLLKPKFRENFFTILECFICDLMLKNPTCQLGIIAILNGEAQLISETSGQMITHLLCLRKLNIFELSDCKNPSGYMLIQNSLDMLIKRLEDDLDFRSCCALFLIAAISSIDPDTIKFILERAKRNQVCVSFIGLRAESPICRYIAEQTGGHFSIALNESQLVESLQRCIFLQSREKENETFLVPVGFPPHNNFYQHLKLTQLLDPFEKFRRTASILDKIKLDTLEPCNLICPQCKSEVCDLPTYCPNCGLFLVSGPHIAMSYNNSRSVLPFEEIPDADIEFEYVQCHGCNRKISESYREDMMRCNMCFQYYCSYCDQYVHEILCICPSCDCQLK
jgi:transcription initiation factor TFIIH subunit 2